MCINYRPWFRLTRKLVWNFNRKQLRPTSVWDSTILGRHLTVTAGKSSRCLTQCDQFSRRSYQRINKPINCHTNVQLHTNDNCFGLSEVRLRGLQTTTTTHCEESAWVRKTAFLRLRPRRTARVRKCWTPWLQFLSKLTEYSFTSTTASASRVKLVHKKLLESASYRNFTMHGYEQNNCTLNDMNYLMQPAIGLLMNLEQHMLRPTVDEKFRLTHAGLQDSGPS